MSFVGVPSQPPMVTVNADRVTAVVHGERRLLLCHTAQQSTRALCDADLADLTASSTTAGTS